MALTMTRTRTQTALTKLVEMLANVNGEMEFLEGLLARENEEGVRERLLARQAKLHADKRALTTAIRQFDPALEPEGVGAAAGWEAIFGQRRLTRQTLRLRYLSSLLK